MFFVLIAGTIIAVVYEAADKDGWFGHDRKVLVWIERDWLPGEFMNVEFRGSMTLLEAKKQSNWNCQRKELSIACKTE